MARSTAGFGGYHAPGREPSAGTFLHNQAKWFNEDKRDAQRRRPGDEGFDPTTLYVPPNMNKDPRFKSMFTPMLVGWWEVKAQNLDCILIYKVGTFYELYNDDAETGVRELGLSWMGGGAAGSNVAHAGFPEQSFSKYVSVLADRNYRCIRVEQTETSEARDARKKGSQVRREVVGIVSAGTCMEEEMLMDHRPRKLLTVTQQPSATTAGCSIFGVCIVDASTGKFDIGTFEDDQYLSRLTTLVAQLRPAELVFPRDGLSEAVVKMLKREVPGLGQCPRMPAQFWDAKKTLQELAGHSVDDFGGNDGVDYFESEGATADDAEYATWPDELRKLALAHRGMGDQGLDERARGEADVTLHALGGCLSLLRTNMIDRDLVSLKNFQPYVPYDAGGERLEGGGGPRYMVLDSNSLSNLEIMVNEEGEERGSLFGHLNHCVTEGGQRMLRAWLQAPLFQAGEINDRLDAVTELMGLDSVTRNMRTAMKRLPDFERLLLHIHVNGRKDDSHPRSRAIIMSYCPNERRTRALQQALMGFKDLAQLVQDAETDIGRLHGGVQARVLKRLLCTEGSAGADADAPAGSHFPDLTDTVTEFEEAFEFKGDTLQPRPGTHAGFDEATREIQSIKKRLQAYCRQVAAEEDCPVVFYTTEGNNRYQLQVSKANFEQLNDSYTKKGQSGKGAKAIVRFETEGIVSYLQELEEAEQAQGAATAEFIVECFAKFDEKYAIFSLAASSIARLDCLMSLAVASKPGGQLPMCRPVFVEPPADGAPVLELTQAWHPIMANLNSGRGTDFIPNDTTIGGEATSATLVLTGPNMGGKSTLLRQLSLATIMAQLGCYVPAASCVMSPVDRIFTRMGARDNIFTGESTFFIELSEAAIVLRNATRHSLVLMDELGRGTSTFDGVAIAYAVAKTLANDTCCRNVFSTHYHTLMPDFAADPAMAICHMNCLADETSGNDITFLYKLTSGAIEKSFGMHVAKLGGLPDSIVHRAQVKSKELEARQRAALARNLLKQLAAGKAVGQRLFQQIENEFGAGAK